MASIYTCTECGTNLNLQTNHLYPPDFYFEAGNKGTLSFSLVDATKFTFEKEDKIRPFFETLNYWGIQRNRTKIKCNCCRRVVGYVYDDGQPLTDSPGQFHFGPSQVIPRAPRRRRRRGKMAVKSKYARGPLRKTSQWTVFFGALMAMSFLVLILLAMGILSVPSSSRNAPKAHDLSSIVHSTLERSDGDEESGGDQWVEIISWEPRAVIYHNFLSKEECKYLINLAKPHMQKSTVVDSATGKSKDSRVRTSSGTFLARGRDKIIRNIEKRIADFTFLPAEHGEGLQILHYEVGQKYEPHYDYFLDDFNTKNGGQRIATVLMYLSDVEEGGETVFPAAKGNFSSVPWWNELSECGKGGLSVKPKTGDALLFWSMKPDATLDPSSLHGGCAVINGNKWSSTKWIRVNEYKV